VPQVKTLCYLFMNIASESGKSTKKDAVGPALAFAFLHRLKVFCFHSGVFRINLTGLAWIESVRLNAHPFFAQADFRANFLSSFL